MWHSAMTDASDDWLPSARRLRSDSAILKRTGSLMGAHSEVRVGGSAPASATSADMSELKA